MYLKRKKSTLLCVAFLGIFTTGSFAAAKKEIPVFLFSGQSNMVCLGSETKDLPSEDRNKIYENIMIHNRSDQAKSNWTPLKPGFGADNFHFGPELYFGKVLSDSMPDAKFAFIKDASSGTYLGEKNGGWLPPSSGGPGTLYTNMMNHIENALKTFNDAFDTTLYEPKWAGFVWLQGEFDAWNNASLANKYEENLTNLIKDIRTMAKADSLPVIIPMISGSMWAHIRTIHAANIAVTQKLVNVDTMNTNGYKFSNDNIHFNAESQIKIGSICAQRWLNMKYWPSTTSINKISLKPFPVANVKSINSVSFDLTGRKVMRKATGNLRNVPNMIINVNGNKAEKKLPIYFK